MAQGSALALVTDIFVAPFEALAALKERPRVALPLLVLLAGYVAVTFTYMYKVDLGWMVEQQLDAAAVQLTETQREQAISRAAEASPALYATIGSASTCVIVLLVMFLTSLYYTIVSFFSRDGVRLKQWFALIAWCTLPTVLGLLAQLVNLSVNDARFMLQDAINPLSFGSLLGVDRTDATILQRILLGIDVTTLWAISLTVIGYQLWTKSSLLKSVAVVLGPLAAIVAIGTALAYR